MRTHSYSRDEKLDILISWIKWKQIELNRREISRLLSKRNNSLNLAMETLHRTSILLKNMGHRHPAEVLAALYKSD